MYMYKSFHPCNVYISLKLIAMKMSTIYFHYKSDSVHCINIYHMVLKTCLLHTSNGPF